VKNLPNQPTQPVGDRANGLGAVMASDQASGMTGMVVNLSMGRR
jgi:hypothetical protein